MSKKHKKVRWVLNYMDHLLNVFSRVTGSGCVTISALAFLVRIPIGIASSTIGLKMCIINAGIKK